MNGRVNDLNWPRWNGTLLLLCLLSLTLSAPATAAGLVVTLAGPDASGEYDLTWTNGVLEQTSVLGQSWASAGAVGNSYHIAPAKDVGNNKFFRLHDGQGYSANIVGYANVVIPKGFSMIANQFNVTPDNSLSNVFPNPPENTTIYKFNGQGYNSYNFSADNPGWFPSNGSLAPGEGAFVGIDPGYAPSGTNLAFVGQVQLSSFPSLANGCSIISVPIPVSDTLDNLRFPVCENDTIFFFRQDPVGHYIFYNWSADNPGWVPQTPKPKVGESFYLCTGGFCPTRNWLIAFRVGPP